MKIALTYDDGPNPMVDEKLLSIFEKHQVKATFFMIGMFVNMYAPLAKKIYDLGHQVGNHTHTHPKLTEIQHNYVYAELSICNIKIQQVTGAKPTLFRPPYILHNELIDKAARDEGLSVCLYQAAAGDAGEPKTAAEIFDKILKELDGKGGIILMHDGAHDKLKVNRDPTIKATEMLIEHFKAAGAEFVYPQELTNAA